MPLNNPKDLSGEDWLLLLHSWFRDPSTVDILTLSGSRTSSKIQGKLSRERDRRQLLRIPVLGNNNHGESLSVSISQHPPHFLPLLISASPAISLTLESCGNSPNGHCVFTSMSHPTGNRKERAKQLDRARYASGKEEGLAKPVSNSASSRFTETCGLDIGLPRNRLTWRGLQMSVISTHAGDLYKPITVPREDRHLLLWVCGDWNNQAHTFTPCAYWTNLLIRLGEEASSFTCFLIVGMGSLRASSEVWCALSGLMWCNAFIFIVLAFPGPALAFHHPTSSLEMLVYPLSLASKAPACFFPPRLPRMRLH